MKKRRHLICAIMTLCLIALCLSCGGGSDTPGDSSTVQTISWQADAGGFDQYSTNDPSLYSTSHHHTNNTIQTIMTSVETQVKRMSGNSGTGYGIYFCYQDPSNTYRILITTTGYYLISKRVSGITYYYVSGSWSATNSSWPTSSNLITGFGKTNNIKVVSNGVGTFDVYFNGTWETSFTDSTFTGGDFGYYAYVSDSSRENFPATPADLRFKQIAPDLSTANSVRRILWQDDGNGFAQYSTNDTNDCGPLFNLAIGSQFMPMSSVEMQVKKMSGSSHNSYGILFCSQDLNNYYRIGITVDGAYSICKRVSGTYYYYSGGGSWSTTNSSWPTNSNLIQGFGNTNDIKVVNAGGGNFNIYFNGVLETSFTDTTFTGGYNGYSASVGSVSQENFPTPSDVRIKLIAAD